MKIVRLSATVVILSALVVGFVLDQEPRTFDDVALVDHVGTPATSTGTWFCPGGSLVRSRYLTATVISV